MPGGIFALLASDKPVTGDPSLSNPDVLGYRLRTGWHLVQPKLGAFSFAYMDSVVSEAAAKGKRVGIGVAAGVASPAELFTVAGAQKFTLAPDDVSIEKLPPDMPVPWDPVFQRYWYDMIDVMGLRYDANPAVAYVVVSGFMQLMEDRLVGTPGDEALMNQLAVDAGYKDIAEAWLTAAKAIVARYAAAFPTTTIVLTTARPFLTNGSAVQGQLLSWGKAMYPGQFGNMAASLHATLPPHNLPLAFGVDPKGDQPIFSTLDRERLYQLPEGGTFTPDPWPADPQPCDDLLMNGAAKGDMWVELYLRDANNAANAPALKSGNVALIANIPPTRR